ncbi:MAG: glycosyltransferase [Fastidiosipilaceae bacterium]|jgi:glycosyltransferase involved in cell wall biosynthesis
MENKKILVSILVPVYNTEEYLRQCLDSLINQTLKDIEIICVNDGSTDNSPKILNEYAQKDGRVKIVNKSNGGLPSARNAGIDVARGEYVGFVDSDDYVEPNMFKKLYTTAKQHNSEVVVCGAKAIPENPEPSQWIKDTLSPHRVVYKKLSHRALFEERGARPFLWRNLIKLDLLNRHYFRLKEDIILGEDQAFQFRVFPKAKGISFIPDKLYVYRWCRPGSIMSKNETAGLKRKVYSHVKLVKHIFEELKKTDDIKIMRKELLRWSSEFIYGDFIGLSKFDKIILAKEITRVWGHPVIWKKEGFEHHINDMFRYFYDLAKEEKPEEGVALSIIVNLDKNTVHIGDLCVSLTCQDFRDFEVVLINNGCDVDLYEEISKWATVDYRVRIINREENTKSEIYNLGLGLSEGKKVLFMNPHSFLSQKDALSQQLTKMAEAGAEVLYMSEIQGKRDLENGRCLLEDLIMDKNFISENNLEFKENVDRPEQTFAAEILSASPKLIISTDNINPISRRADLRNEWVYSPKMLDAVNGFRDLLALIDEAEEIINKKSIASKRRAYNRQGFHNREDRMSIEVLVLKILTRFRDLLIETGKTQMATEHRAIVEIINSARMYKLIIDSAKPYVNKKEKGQQGIYSFQGKVFELLIGINRNIKQEFISPHQKCLLILFKGFIDARHEFLNTLKRKMICI